MGLNGSTQKECANAWLNLLSLADENIRQEILKIFLLEVLDKLGDSSKTCLDLLTKLAKTDPDDTKTNPSSLLATTCMIKLLINFENVEYTKIYEDAFYKLQNVNLIDSDVKIINLILQSTYLPVFMRSKIIRQLAILANSSSKSEISSKCLSVISFQQRLNPDSNAFIELEYDQEFKYSFKNKFKIGGIETCFPELVNLRRHIEPEIVLQAGNIISNIQKNTTKISPEEFHKTSLLENTLISVDFDEINPEDVELIHDKSNM